MRFVAITMWITPKQLSYYSYLLIWFSVSYIRFLFQRSRTWFFHVFRIDLSQKLSRDNFSFLIIAISSNSSILLFYNIFPVDILYTSMSYNIHFKTFPSVAVGILLTCIFMSASPVWFPHERHDVESDQPAFLEPADTAAIDRGLFLCSVTKGPKCGHSLFLFFLSLPNPPLFSSSRSLSLFLCLCPSLSRARR